MFELHLYTQSHLAPNTLFLQANRFTTTTNPLNQKHFYTRNLLQQEPFFTPSTFSRQESCCTSRHLSHQTGSKPFRQEAFYTKTFDTTNIYTMLHQNPTTEYCTPELVHTTLFARNHCTDPLIHQTLIQPHTHQNPFSQQKPL